MSSHNILQALYSDGTPYDVKDPGDAGTLIVDRQFAQFKITTVSTETNARTLAQPTKANIICNVTLDVDGGDLTLTVTGGYNADAATSITFADAGDFVTFISIEVGTSYYWRILAQEGTNVAGETLDVDTLSIGGTAITATAAELNNVADVSAQDVMAPSSVIAALIEQYDSSVRRVGNLIKTEILLDITGAKSVATDHDIIGNTGVCHFGQITAAVNGTILCGQMTCLEVPVGGADDIDLYMSSAATGAYDADGTALANAASLITKGGAWALSAPGAATAFTAPVTANYYLYLLSGEAAAGTYTAGKFLIELWGLPA